MQGRARDADTEGLEDMVGKGEGLDGIERSSSDMYTIPYITQVASRELLYGTGNSLDGRDGGGWEGEGLSRQGCIFTDR